MNKKQKKSVLITGCAGFIGSHLTKHYLNEGYLVFGIDNFCSSKNNSKHFIELQSHKNFNFFAGDICDNRFLHDVDYHLYLENIKLDLVYNFACPASPPIYQKLPIETLLTCTQGFNNIINLAQKNNKNVIIVHASTSEVYGDPNITPQPETYRGNVNSYGIRSNYDEGKRAAEALAFDWLNKYNIDVRLVRIFNTSGPQMCKDDGRVVTNFINQILNNKDITVFGNGLQTRSFCYIEDTIKGIIKIGNLKENPKTPINIGNPNEFTILDLAYKILKLIPFSTSKIVYKDLPGDDPTQRCPDISLAKKLLNWEPKVDLETGLNEMIIWAKENKWKNG